MSGEELMRMFAQRELTPAEREAMDRRIDRVRRNIQEGRADKPQAPHVSPDDIREKEQDSMQGWDKKPEAWNQVMERHGFKWYESVELDERIGLQEFIPRMITDESRVLSVLTTRHWTFPAGI